MQTTLHLWPAGLPTMRVNEMLCELNEGQGTEFQIWQPLRFCCFSVVKKTELYAHVSARTWQSVLIICESYTSLIFLCGVSFVPAPPHCPPGSVCLSLIDSLLFTLPPFLPVLSSLYWINEGPSRRYQDKHKSSLSLTRK